MKQNSIITINDYNNVKELDYINSIWLAIMTMDVYTLLNLLDDNMTYEDLSKSEFVELLNDRFNSHKSWGDSELLMDLDHCKGCNCDQPICKFLGNNSGRHFGLYFEIENGDIKDIYHCNWYGDFNLDSLF